MPTLTRHDQQPRPAKSAQLPPPECRCSRGFARVCQLVFAPLRLDRHALATPDDGGVETVAAPDGDAALGLAAQRAKRSQDRRLRCRGGGACKRSVTASPQRRRKHRSAARALLAPKPAHHRKQRTISDSRPAEDLFA
eukprot:3708149-Pleurochrysis_carterae.AAC.2